MSDDSYQRAINEVRALREHQNGDSLPDEREIISALRTAQFESRPIFETADAFDAVKPFLVARDEKITRLKQALRVCRSNAHNDWTVRETVDAALEASE